MSWGGRNTVKWKKKGDLEVVPDSGESTEYEEQRNTDVKKTLREIRLLNMILLTNSYRSSCEVIIQAPYNGWVRYWYMSDKEITCDQVLCCCCTCYSRLIHPWGISLPYATAYASQNSVTSRTWYPAKVQWAVMFTQDSGLCNSTLCTASLFQGLAMHLCTPMNHHYPNPFFPCLHHLSCSQTTVYHFLSRRLPGRLGNQVACTLHQKAKRNADQVFNRSCFAWKENISAWKEDTEQYSELALHYSHWVRKERKLKSPVTHSFVWYTHPWQIQHTAVSQPSL